MNDDLTLGRLLGRREAFNIVAARCSAADAATLREIREKKLYLNHSKDWDAFCVDYLHTTKETANRVIRYLDEFGPAYFEVSQLTRISPATYRAIAPAIQDQALHHNGETIALIPENAGKLAAAVAELRTRDAAAKPAPEPEDPMVALGRRCDELVSEFEALAADTVRRYRVRGTIAQLSSRLNRIGQSL
jgi:hypothetical protein